MTTYTVACKNPHCGFIFAAQRPGPAPLYCPRCGYHRVEHDEGRLDEAKSVLEEFAGEVERVDPGESAWDFPGLTDRELHELERILELSKKADQLRMDGPEWEELERLSKVWNPVNMLSMLLAEVGQLRLKLGQKGSGA